MLNNPEPLTLDECAERALEDYKRVSAFIRARAPQDPDVQAAANAALNTYRLLLGKLTHLAVTLEGERQP
jgi:hypothetical protein